uniref:Uncharacterized protein n=1 Tax=Arundo donax TaxID=35708 RepID=A0A0A9FYS8_ARUDO
MSMATAQTKIMRRTVHGRAGGASLPLRAGFDDGKVEQ